MNEWMNEAASLEFDDGPIKGQLQSEPRARPETMKNGTPDVWWWLEWQAIKRRFVRGDLGKGGRRAWNYFSYLARRPIFLGYKGKGTWIIDGICSEVSGKHRTPVIQNTELSQKDWSWGLGLWVPNQCALGPEWGRHSLRATQQSWSMLLLLPASSLSHSHLERAARHRRSRPFGGAHPWVWI